MFGIGYLCCLTTFLSWVIGIYTVVHTLICIGFYVFRTYIRKPMPFIERYGKGSWAVITGPTAGIGEAYATEFARHGFNLVLVGRNQEKLDSTSSFVKSLNISIKVKTVLADFAQSMEPEFYQAIYDQVKDLDVSVLVNNAGVAERNYHLNIDPQKHFEMINTNCGGVVMLSKMFIDKFMARKTRSAILNVSSVVSVSPISFLGSYSASKSFVSFLSNGLHLLYKSKIDILDVKPGYVTTKMTGHKVGPDACTPKECVVNSLKSLGHDFDIFPFWAHVASAQFLHVTYRFCRPVWRAMAVGAIETKVLKDYYNKNEEAKQAKKDD